MEVREVVVCFQTKGPIQCIPIGLKQKQTSLVMLGIVIVH